MKFWSQLGERELDLEVVVHDRHLEVDAGGRKLAADFVPLPDGEVYSLLIDGHDGRTLAAGMVGATLPSGALAPSTPEGDEDFDI